MTTIELSQQRGHLAHGRPEADKVRRVLLSCGVLYLLAYIAADIVGGLTYHGYSFSSQAVSELMATGSPSERFVDPLFLLSGALLLAFGTGVYRESAGRNRALRITAALLILQALLDFTGPTLFEMNPRGSAGIRGDTPHIILTAALVLAALATMGFGAFALGKRFRVYSLVTLVTVLVLGALSAPYGSKLAAGQPTPGFGIIERVNIYASIAWVAVLAIALLRGQSQRRAGILS